MLLLSYKKQKNVLIPAAAATSAATADAAEE